MNNKQQVGCVKYCGEKCVKEEAGKQKFAQLDIVPQNAYFYLPYQNIVTAYVLFFYQTKFFKLFKMVEGNAWAAEMEGALDFANTHWTASF